MFLSDDDFLPLAPQSTLRFDSYKNLGFVPIESINVISIIIQSQIITISNYKIKRLICLMMLGLK